MLASYEKNLLQTHKKDIFWTHLVFCNTISSSGLTAKQKCDASHESPDLCNRYLQTLIKSCPLGTS